MTVLREICNVKQPPGALLRRWFTASDMDLFVWCEEDGTPVQFELSYDKGAGERAITWCAIRGLRHAMVDDGEGMGAGVKSSPILRNAPAGDMTRLVQLLRSRAMLLPPAITSLLETTIGKH